MYNIFFFSFFQKKKCTYFTTLALTPVIVKLDTITKYFQQILLACSKQKFFQNFWIFSFENRIAHDLYRTSQIRVLQPKKWFKARFVFNQL